MNKPDPKLCNHKEDEDECNHCSETPKWMQDLFSDDKGGD